MILESIHLRDAAGHVRTEHFDGREHLVLPVVAMIGEQVVHAVNSPHRERVTTATLAKAAASFERKPVVLGHPTKGGQHISANDPTVLETHGLGFIQNSRMDGSRLLMDVYIDPAKAEKLGGKQFVEDLRASKPCDVSVGAMVACDQTPGELAGKTYAATWIHTAGDHLAVLPKGLTNGRGACSWDSGCGIRAAMHLVTAEGFEVEEGSMALETPSGLKARVAAFFRSLMPRGWGDDEVKQELRDALNAVEPAMARSGGEIVRVKNDVVVYCLYPPTNYYDAPMGPGATMTYWQREYTFDTATQKFSVSAQRDQVEPATVYLKVAAAKDCPTCGGTGQTKTGDTQADCEACGGTGQLKAAANAADPEAALRAAACGCQGDITMERKALIDMLSKHEHNPTKNVKALEILSDAELTGLETYCAGQATLKAAADKDAADKKAADEKAAADLKAERDKTRTLEERLTALSEKKITVADLPADLKAIVERDQARELAEKTALVTTLKAAQSVYSEERLTAMSVSQLQEIAALAKVDAPKADYSGRGIPRALTAPESESYAPPDPWARDIKALQSKTVN